MLTSIEQVVVTEPVPDGALVALYSRYCLPVDDHDPRERVTLLLHHCLGLRKSFSTDSVQRPNFRHNRQGDLGAYYFAHLQDPKRNGRVYGRFRSLVGRGT